IYTLYAVKLDSIIEFRDTNRNNVADYGRLYNSTTGRFSDYFNRFDTLYKKVDLHTNWTRDAIQRTNDTTYRTWTFNLTAGNLSYANVANNTGSTALPPPTVRFTFHLNASLEEVNNATVPQWRVTVDTAGGRNDVVTSRAWPTSSSAGKPCITISSGTRASAAGPTMARTPARAAGLSSNQVRSSATPSWTVRRPSCMARSSQRPLRWNRRERQRVRRIRAPRGPQLPRRGHDRPRSVGHDRRSGRSPAPRLRGVGDPHRRHRGRRR